MLGKSLNMRGRCSWFLTPCQPTGSPRDKEKDAAEEREKKERREEERKKGRKKERKKEKKTNGEEEEEPFWYLFHPHVPQ